MFSKVGQGQLAAQVSRPMAPQEAPSAGRGMDLEKMGVQVESSRTVSEGSADTQATNPKFGDIWNKIMAKDGQAPDKPREVKKTLGKDDFLKLMIHQLKFQDPSKPFEMEKMGSELAQLSNMEQLQNLNTTLKQMVTKDQPLERLAMTNLIGKTVVVDRDRFPHTEGQAEALHFNLPQDAAKVTVAVVDATGEVVVEKDVGPSKKGENSFSWDGKKSNSLPAKTGSYTLMVKAMDANGGQIPVPKHVNAGVVGVSYEGNEPILLVGSANSPDKVGLKQVVRIIDHGPQIPGAVPLSSVAAAGVTPSSVTQPGQKNFFTFEKGVGSRDIDRSKLGAEASRALEIYEQQAREAGQSAQAGQPAPEGFPNGLSGAENAGPGAENTDFSAQ
jgi:flagellar basal-body rod modification protein FlgD